ncbi:MAG: nicotinate (nicotinamide) nucleotide adenylyltransferase [Sedimentisphaerales bacterium]
MIGTMTEKKIVCFGGTFDPVHLGHTAVAAEAGEHIGADRVIFVPARRSPLKALGPEASDNDRLEMLRLALSGNSRFALTDYELKQPGPNYTIETVRHFKKQFEDAEIYWLLGADTVDDLQHWHCITELLDECNMSVMFRGGVKPPDFSRFESIWGRQRVEKLERNIVETPLIDISSTEIRSRLSTGRDVSGMVNQMVLQYIREHGLYGSGTAE